MVALIDVILPVFLVLGFGYAAARLGLFGDAAIDGVQRFAQNFAVPVLLMQSMARLDLSLDFDLAMLAAFYAGAFAGYFAGWAAARFAFGRGSEDAVAIGFVCMFSNTLLLGLPITERAYGEAALAGNFAIIAMHSPLLYTFGITVMEFTRARGQRLSVGSVALRALMGVLRTPLVIGIMAGLALNLALSAGLVLPQGAWDAVGIMARAAIPAALFGLGGVLHRYRPAGDAGMIAVCVAASLLLHPAITWGVAGALEVGTDGLRSAVVTAAMPSGVNAYLFAAMYGVAMRVAASSVLIGTAATIVTAAFWLSVLP
ncbi:AEC family transporter [Paracoccus sp. S-4012]|uniref:AEC family transporter n=1 Tax=Paracoccus sp. S-4012 TaxID=2665648 RepID=UPI0012B13909|nr:AEC family transporter [Paracoccus sp. S-4012]MRX50569.1 AEC family transporter [Paracoccus sp. S-4012]